MSARDYKQITLKICMRTLPIALFIILAVIGLAVHVYFSHSKHSEFGKTDYSQFPSELPERVAIHINDGSGNVVYLFPDERAVSLEEVERLKQ